MLKIILKRITNGTKEVISNEVAKLAEVERQKANILFDIDVHNTIAKYNKGGK